MFNDCATNILTVSQGLFKVKFRFLVITSHVQYPGMSVKISPIIRILLYQTLRQLKSPVQFFFSQRKIVAVVIENIVVVRIDFQCFFIGCVRLRIIFQAIVSIAKLADNEA